MVPDPYKLLQVEHHATGDQIKRSYRELARRNHPDRLTQASDEEREEATIRFSRISAAYALLTDAHRKQEYDHVYKYGGYDDEEEDEEKEKEQRKPNGVRSQPSRKRNSVGYACVDPFAFIIGGNTKMAVAGIQIPSRVKMGNGLSFAFSSGQIRTSPSGSRVYTAQTTQFAQGKKHTKTETTTVHPDGRREIIIEGNNGDFVERRCISPVDREAMAQAEQSQPWYTDAWHGIREKLTMCTNPCVVTQ
jgi:curved DNA-binding protein CbpA